MPVKPKFYGPDQIPRESVFFTTTSSSYFFTGTLDPDAIDLRVSINGTPLISDTSLYSFENNGFVIPNPSLYPNGLDLLPGINTISVASIQSSGGLLGPSVLTVKLVQEDNLSSALLPPTGVSIERLDGSVRVSVEGLSDESVVGYNFYASREIGGGSQGYFRINAQPVISGVSEEIETTLGEFESDITPLQDEDGVLVTSPLYLNFLATQQDRSETVLKTDFSESYLINQDAEQLRASITLKNIRTKTIYSFEHSRNATLSSTPSTLPNASFSGLLSQDPLYYVVTALYLIDGVQYESVFSPEIAGYPFVVTPTISSLPTVSRQQIVRDLTLSIFKKQPNIDLKPGSVVRDVFIEPSSSEVERLRFVLDFIHKSQSFATLLSIDDPQRTGVSLPVSQSPYKQALKQAFYLSSDQAVQSMMDNSFELVASRFGEIRLPGKRARGSVVIYTKTRPTQTINLSIGTAVVLGGQKFLLTSSVVLDSNNLASAFDPKTGRYVVSAFVQAQDIGSSFNIAGGQTGFVEGFKFLTVQNTSNLIGGSDPETNYQLSLRCQNKLASVDSGTYQGIKNNILSTRLVEQVNIVDAGDAFMFRDLLDGEHLGGKVDAWIKGSLRGTVSDSFTFGFGLALKKQFQVIGDPQDLKLRAVDSNLSENNPILELVSIPDYDFVLYNQTKEYEFDITDYSLVSYNTVQLSSNYNDPLDISLSDVITGYYRYRTSNVHVFNSQPVFEIKTLQGERSGTISNANFVLYKSQDPLYEGQSYLSQDQLQLQDLSLDLEPVEVLNEAHVIVSDLEYLNFLGANPWSLKVYNKARTILYDGPFTDGSDYTIIYGSSTKPLAISIPNGSRIQSGDTLSIDYFRDETFTVSYVYDSLVGVIQNQIDKQKHITADILVKSCVEVPVKVSATVVLDPNRQKNTSQMDGEIRTALSRLFSSLTIGQPVRQSDVVRTIDSVSGVSYVVTPLTILTRESDSFVPIEEVIVTNDTDFEKIQQWSSPTVSTWLLKNSFNWDSQSFGGPSNSFRVVYKNKQAMEMMGVYPNLNGYPLKVSKGRACIIGSEGLEIPGYNDTSTLESLYTFNTDPIIRAKEIAAKKKELSLNRILVTLDPEEEVLNQEWKVSYLTNTSTKTQNIEISSIEYLVLGDVELTFDEDSLR